MRKWYFFKTTGEQPDRGAASHAADENSNLETRNRREAADGAGARRMKGRIAGWYRSLMQKRRPDRGAGAD